VSDGVLFTRLKLHATVWNVGYYSLVISTEVRGRNLNGSYTRFAGLGFTFMILIGAFTLGGYGLDRLLGTVPLFVLLGMVVGFAGALYYLFVKMKELGGG
jgi:hypothetical protein